MKVLRSVLVAFSFGLMMSCSNSAGTAENGGENAAAVVEKTPMEKAIDGLQAVVDKAEACNSMDEFNALANEWYEAMEKMREVAKAEIGENPSEEKMKEIEKYEDKVNNMDGKMRAIVEKLMK